MSDGLEGVVAADTVLSEVDGQAGRLIIRGRSLDELAGRTTYEEVTRLLWDGFFEALPDDLAPALAAARLEVFQEVSALETGQPGGGGGARHLPGHGQRPWAERVHLRRPGDRLDPRRPDLGGAGR